MGRTAKRPVIRIRLGTFDWVLEFVSFVSLLFLFVIVGTSYGDLPERMPTKFGFDGQPTSYSSKGTVWLLPLISLKTYAMLMILNRFPHIFNYPVAITPENARVQYALATRFMRCINAMIMLMMALIGYEMILAGLGNKPGITIYVTISFILVLFLSIIVYLYFSSKKR